MTWIVFSLIATMCWAAVQLVDKSLIEHEAPSPSHYLFVTGLASFPVVVVGLFFDMHDADNISPQRIMLSITAGASYFLASAFFFYSLTILDASVAAAAAAVVPAVAAIAAWLMLNQSLSILPAIGIALITSGVVIMNLRGAEGSSRSVDVSKAWWAMVIAILVLVVEYVIEGYVVRDAAPTATFYWTRVGVALATALFAIVWFKRAAEAVRWMIRRRRVVASLSLGNEALDMLAAAALIAAYASGPVGLATGVAYANPAIVYAATIAINTIRPNTIPSKNDMAHRVTRALGITVVVAGVLLATAGN